LDKLPCRQKVAAVDIGKGDVLVQGDFPVAQSGDPVEDVPMAQSGGAVVGPPNKESPDPSILVVGPPSEDLVVGPPSEESTGRFVKPLVSTTSTETPLVISVASIATAAPVVISSPSEASPGRFVKPSVPTAPTGDPVVIPLGLSVSSTPTVDPIVFTAKLPPPIPALKEHPKLSPFTSTKVPTAAKR
jgi:hypothetical protein